MKTLIRLIIVLQAFGIITACGVKYEFKERNNEHKLINPEKQNTYAFLGNSITHDGRYHSYLELFLLTRYPDVEFEFINAGVAGDQAGIALSRLKDDLLYHEPDIVTVMFGMNDIGRNLYGQENLKVDSMVMKQNRNLANYATYLDSLTRRILNSGAEVVLFTPSIYEQNAEKLATLNLYGCNDALERCAIIVRELNKKIDSYLVDHFQVMDSLNNILQKVNPDTTIVGPDRVHPQDVGHFIMASNIIEQLEFSPLVASVEINLKNKKIVSTNANIKEAILHDSILKFQYFPKALPFPTTEFKEVAKLTDFNEKMNREILTTQGLSEGSYMLTINSTEVGVFNEADLDRGINMSEFFTPQKMHASEIAGLVELKRQIISDKLRNIAFIEYFYAPDVKTATDSFEAIKIVETRLEEDLGKSYYGYLESQVNLYKEVKKELPVIKSKIDSLNLEIHKLRKSIPGFEISLEKTSL